MDRRGYLQGIDVTTAGIGSLLALPEMDGRSASDPLGAATASASLGAPVISTEGRTLLCRFIRGSETWKVYEDLRTREGSIDFVSVSGAGRVLTRNAEATFAEANPPYLGLSISDTSAWLAPICWRTDCFTTATRIPPTSCIRLQRMEQLRKSAVCTKIRSGLRRVLTGTSKSWPTSARPPDAAEHVEFNLN
jgi:hypothetical protein